MDNRPWWEQRFAAQYLQPQQQEQPAAPPHSGSFFGDLVNNVKKTVKRGVKDVESGAAKAGSFFGNMIEDTAKTAVKVPVQFAEDFANTFGNLGTKAAGGKNKTIQQNMGTDPVSKAILNFSGATGKNSQLAGDVAQIGSTALLPEAGGELLPNLARSAASGALASGGQSAADNQSPVDVLRAALEGGTLGAVLEGAPKIFTKGGRAQLAQLPSDVRDATSIKPVYAHSEAKPPATTPNIDNTPLSELGGQRPANDLQTKLEDAWNSNDLDGAQKLIDQMPPDMKQSLQPDQDAKIQAAAAVGPDQHSQLASALTGEAPAPPAARELNPDEQSHMEAVHGTAAEYPNAESYIHDLAQNALDSEKSKGVSLIPQAEGGYKRSSEHADWYSQLYQQLGHKPSVAQTEDTVRSALEQGRPSSSLVGPGDVDIYHQLQDRESGLQQTISQGPPTDLPVSYMDSLAGKTNGVETPPVSSQAKLKLGNSRGSFQDTPLPDQPAGPEFPDNQRGFLGSLQTSPKLPDEARQAIADIAPQTYDPYTNEEAMQAGRQIIGDDKEAAANKILSSEHLDTDHEAAALQLIHQYSHDRDFDKMVQIADKLDQSGREHGRGVQILSALNRMTPDGAVYYTNKLIGRAGEKISAGRGYGKGVEEAKNIAKQYRQQLNDAGSIKEGDVRTAVHDIASRGPIKPSEDQLDFAGHRTGVTDSKLKVETGGKPAEGQLDINGEPFKPTTTDSTTGEQVAKNVEKMATPAKKAKANDLVREITKKVKQEMMDQEKPVSRSPIDVMREVFSRNAEAQEAFPEAQRILLAKAKDNPELQKTLQKFFDSELGNPVAGSTVNAAIKEQLKTNETKISDIISKSYSEQRTSIEQVAADLTKNGFDEDSAKSIAKDVVSRLQQQTAEAKQRALAALDKEVPKRYKKTFVEKVSKLSNLGALTDGDFLDLAKAKLKLPHMTQELAQQVHDMAQEIQDAPEGYERDQLERKLMHTVNESIPKTKGQKLAELVSAPKALQATADISGTLHQGLILGSRFPKQWKEAFGKQVTYLKSDEQFNRDMSAIKHDDEYNLARRAKIDLTGVEGGEEAFASQAPERIPGVGKIVQASDRAYTGALTHLRYYSFKNILSDMKDAGIDTANLSDDQLQSLGKFINTASGRGHGNPGGLFEKVAPALNRTLFSPRLWKSRLDMLNPAYYAKLDPVARKYALQAAGNFAGIAATVLTLASVMGAKVETDPRSSDFLKVRFGDTRYDILGGFQQNLVFAARELAGSTKSSTTGTVSSLTGGGALSQNRLSVLTSLIQNKENPVIGAGEDLLRGTDTVGNPTNPWTTIGSLGIPLNLQDYYGATKGSDPVSALISGYLPSAVGLGVNSYPAPGDAGTTSQFSQFQNALGGSR